MGAIKKIVVIGPESTGKSTLCKHLADHYKTIWVPEYAREYLLKYGTDYSYNDLLTIGKGQINLEEDIIRRLSTTGEKTTDPKANRPASRIAYQTPGQPLLFIDTDMYVMKVWCEYVFNKCHPWILNRIAERHYDGYLLCNPDLDWIPDELREYPDKLIRERLYYYYRDLMINQPRPWIDVSGSYEERLDKAKSFISHTFSNED